MAGLEAEAAHSECEAPARLWGAQTDEAVAGTHVVARVDGTEARVGANTGEGAPFRAR